MTDNSIKGEGLEEQTKSFYQTLTAKAVRLWAQAFETFNKEVNTEVCVGDDGRTRRNYYKNII